MATSEGRAQPSGGDPQSWPRQRVGDYSIGRTFAKGSFGKVKEGEHIPTGQKVAIKVLSRQKITTSHMNKKIKREISILKLFNHPNICRLYDVVYTPTDILLVMEYVDGGELYDFIVKKGMLHEDAARYVFQQIVCALEYCHHFRVAHRDLKPENILLGSNLSVKLIDFGLSNVMHDGDFLKTSCGSPNYAAPEVISGKLYEGPEIDVWSCGIVLFALLCASLPFDEETIPLLFAKIKKGKFHIPRHVSAGARELIESLLVVDPLARLTIPQIRDHPWFQQSIPKHLIYSEKIFFNDWTQLDPFALSETMQKMEMSEKNVRKEICKGTGPVWVTYNVILDYKNSKERASLAQLREESAQADPSTAEPVVRASDRELNLGLMLTMSPAMRGIIDLGDAATCKQFYNSSSFLPSSVQETKSLGLTRLPSPGTFFITSAASSSTSVPGSLPPISSLRNAPPSQTPPIVSSYHSERPRVGSVAKYEKAYTSEEENFLLQNNVGWRVGIMTDHRSASAMNHLYAVLTGVGMEWKTLSPFHILARFQNGVEKLAESTPVILGMHLFRLQDKHDKGFIFDCKIVKGHSLEAIDALDNIVRQLRSRVG